MIVGDFIIHVDVHDGPDAKKFLDLIDSLGFKQHVNKPTHTAVLRKVVQQNHTRQCQKVLWVIRVPGPLLRLKVFQRHRGKQHN